MEGAGLTTVRAAAARRTRALHVLTRRGLRAAGRPELEPVAIRRLGAAAHLLAARARLARARGGARATYGARRESAERGAEDLAAPRAGRCSAEVGLAPDGTVALHRPDLVCWGAGAPIAIEVELTVKAPARLRTIVRGWAPAGSSRVSCI